MSFNKDNTLEKFDIKKNNFTVNNTTDKISTIKESEKKPTLSKLKIFIIVASVVVVVAVAIILIVILTRKKKDDLKRNPLINETNIISTDIDEIAPSTKDTLLDTTKETIQSTLKTTMLNSTTLATSKIEIDEENKISTIIVSNSPDINQIDINYEEAQNFINLKEIKESHDVLDKSSNDLDELILSCNNTNFSEFNVTLNDIPDNIESLIKNADEVSPNLLAALKPQLNLYHSKYESLSKEVTSMNEEALKSINNFISPKLLELKEDLNNVTINFEKRIQILAIPFKLNLTKNKNNLRNLDDNSDDKMIEEISSMLKEGKDLYDKILKIIDIWKRVIKATYKWLDYINIRLMGGIIDFNSFIGSFGEIFINEVINKLRDDFFSVLGDYSDEIDKVDLIIQESIKVVDELKNSFQSFLRENHGIVEEINKKIKEICENNNLEIFGLDINLENIYNSVVEKIDLLVGGFNFLQTLFKDITRIYDVKSLTSVDMLFIIDISDTNQPYVNTIKTDLINIIENISSICQDVTMNIGLVEYRYSDEKYLNIDFTENQEYIKRIIIILGITLVENHYLKVLHYLN